VNYFERVKPTYIENWPVELCRLSVAQVDIPLTLDDASRLGSNMMYFGECFLPVRPIDDIRCKVADAVSRFPNGAFVRLGSRSPKDSWRFHENPKIVCGEDPLRLLLDESERIYEDLSRAIKENYAPHIFVRQWLDFEPWQEFRCFQHGGKLVGISQYNYLRDAVFPEIEKYHDTILWGIKNFHGDFRKACHLGDVVFDVIVFIRTNQASPYKAERSVEVKLLEINPFFEFTDPCLFDWRNSGSSFDGSLRFNRDCVVVAD
jgi:hypothetical protein